MKKILIIFMALMLTAQTAGAQFLDIEDDPAKDKIESLEKSGILFGSGDNNFNPSNPVTRAEFVAMVNRAMGYDQKGEKSFNDVFADDWFYNDVKIAAENGFIDGFPDGSFKPGNLINHEQAVKILVSVYETKYSITPSGDMATLFDDYYEISEWARGYVSTGTMLGIAKGYENLTGTDTVLDNETVFGIINDKGIITQFNPKGYTTRSQAADMIYDLLNALKVSEKINI